MKFLVLSMLVVAQLAACSSGPVATRARRSFQHYDSPQLYGNQYYTSQAGYEVLPQPYSAQLSPSLYNTRAVSQGSLYRLPSTSSSYYPSSQTYSTYASAPRVQYTGVQASPAYAQVSAPALYNAEHSEHASSSSHYRLQAPATVTYAQPSVAQYVQPSSAQYVQPSLAQYVQPSVQYVQPSTTQYVQSGGQYAQPSWQQSSYTANNPWC